MGLAAIRLPARTPATVYVCICNGVTDRDIRQAAEAGCRSLPELTMRTGAGANCGSCLELAASLLEQARGTIDLPLTVLPQAA
nr:(2Fe-2S)-binding protein [Lysobacter sp. BMK333-48F3]